jgi:phospholipase/carboxylesterase
MGDSPIIINQGTGEAQYCVIWLHGLGADGHDFEPIVQELNLPADLAIRFIFPHAPMIPVTINNGYVMRAWYDIYAMDIGSRQDEAGIRKSQQYINQMIDQQIADGIPSERIVLAGFSQGGAIVLQTGLRLDKPLAGLMALSTYLPLADSFEAEKTSHNAQTPIFMAHGDSDPVVKPELAYRARSYLERQGYALEWQEYAGMQHGVCAQEISHIRQWLMKIFKAGG